MIFSFSMLATWFSMYWCYIVLQTVWHMQIISGYFLLSINLFCLLKIKYGHRAIVIDSSYHI